MTSLLQLRASELEAKRRSLASELDTWDALAGSAGAWRRHRSQLRRLRTWLGPVLDDPAAAGPADWPAIAEAEPRILAAHSIWEVYRAKLVLRMAPPFQDALWLADDFAWACYEPVQKLKPEADRREPPIIFFSATWSPYVRARDTTLLNELRFADSRVAGVLESDEYRQVVERLPVPLISVPWYQLSHPPSMGVIAHEVGHVVYREFGLAALVEPQMAGIDGPLSDNLVRWAEEMFADIYGCAAGRQGFVDAMLELLAADPHEVRKPSYGVHPPRMMRAELLLLALGRLGPAAAEQALRGRWTEAYGAFDPGGPLAAAIVDRLLDVAVAGVPLRAIFQPPADPQNLASRAAAGQPLQDRTLDARSAILAARGLHDGSLTNGRRLPEDRLAAAYQRLVAFAGKLDVGFRSSHGVFQSAAAQEAALQAREAEDRRRGTLFWRTLPREDQGPQEDQGPKEGDQGTGGIS